MCVTFFGLDVHPEFPFWLAFNRDEFLERPSLPAHIWTDDSDIIGGKDLECGGTWLGLRSNGRVAFLTNYKGPPDVAALDSEMHSRIGTTTNHTYRSRGELTVNFLKGTQAPYDYVKELSERHHLYRGFTLIVGSLFPGSNRELCFLTNCNEQPSFSDYLKLLQLSPSDLPVEVQQLRNIINAPDEGRVDQDIVVEEQKSESPRLSLSSSSPLPLFPAFGRLRPGCVYGLANDRMMYGKKVRLGLQLVRQLLRDERRGAKEVERRDREKGGGGRGTKDEIGATGRGETAFTEEEEEEKEEEEEEEAEGETRAKAAKRPREVCEGDVSDDVAEVTWIPKLKKLMSTVYNNEDRNGIFEVCKSLGNGQNLSDADPPNTSKAEGFQAKEIAQKQKCGDNDDHFTDSIGLTKLGNTEEDDAASMNALYQFLDPQDEVKGTIKAMFHAPYTNPDLSKTIFVEAFETKLGTYGTLSQTMIVMNQKGSFCFREDALSPNQETWNTQTFIA